MKVLITGATGLIGSEITRLYRANDNVVHYLTTSKEKIESKSDYKGFYWNPEEGEIDVTCFDGVTSIINLAGATISERWTSSYKKVILDSRVDSLQTLKKGLINYGTSSICSFVSASAIGIYPSSLNKLYEEDEQKIDDSFLGEVAKTWEEASDSFQNLGFPVAKIRIGLVLSDKGGALPQMAKPIKYYAGAPIGSGEQWQSWVHLTDLARIFLHATNQGLSGIFNGVAPNPVTNSKLTKEIAKVLEQPLLLPNVPKFILKLVLGEMSNLLFASQRVSSKKIEEEDFIFHYANVCSALSEIYLTSKVGTEEAICN